MTTQLEQAARLALEALELEDMACRYEDDPTPEHIAKAITTLRAALSDAALDRMAENARELGLDYEQPAQDEPQRWAVFCGVCLKKWSVSYQHPGKSVCAECESKQPAQDEPEFIKHEVENAEDWSEWVCPDPKGYLMECCDCGLVHEAEFMVVRYKSETEREACEPVDNPNLQAVFRMRRSEQWSPVDTAHRAGGLPMEQPAQDEPVELKNGECWPEYVMQEWDYWRKQIADGDKGSAPRDWFEELAELKLVTRLQAREPLTDEMEDQAKRYISPHRRSAFRDGWRSAEQSHGIGEKK